MHLALANMNAIGIGITAAVRMRMRNSIPTSKERILLFSTSTNTSKNSNENQRQYQQQQPKQLKKTKYLLPKRIILIRHGESLGNIDDTAYASIPDWKIPMTRRGERQALFAAKQLADLLDGEALYAYCSPYKRAVQTWEIIQNHLENENSNSQKASDSRDCNHESGVEIIGMREEPRVAEQQFGNFQNPHKVRTAKAERRTFGRFFFRFPNGESGLDVYSRCSSFLATLSRDIKQIDQRYSYTQQNDVRRNESNVDYNGNSKMSSGNDNDNNNNREDAMENMNIIVVCHGLTLRLLLMRYFQLTVEEFENSYNSQNAKLVVMNRFVYDDDDAHDDPGNRKYYCTHSETYQYREYYKLDGHAKEALNLLKADMTRARTSGLADLIIAQEKQDDDCGMLLVDDDEDLG